MNAVVRNIPCDESAEERPVMRRYEKLKQEVKRSCKRNTYEQRHHQTC
jgi:hypothetical protein